VALCSYQQGDPVWLCESVPRHKLAPQGLGGWRVDTMLGLVTARMLNDVGHRKVVHVDKLKARIPRTSSPSVSTWHTVVDQHSENKRGGSAAAQLLHSREAAEDAGRPAQHGDNPEAIAEGQRCTRPDRLRQPPARLVLGANTFCSGKECYRCCMSC